MDVNKPTTKEVDEIRTSFNDLIEAVPKSRRMNHLFALNEVHLILDSLDRKAKGAK